MTRREALIALRDAVRAGGIEYYHWSILGVAMPPHTWSAVKSAYYGSLDAAITLNEAVLPGWGWQVGSCSASDDARVFPDFNCPKHGPRLTAEVPPGIDGREWPEITDIDQRPSGQPARALLLAILEALIAKEGDG